MQKKIPAIRYNYHIEAVTGIVKVINDQGEFIGEMSVREAINMAFSQDFDLVQISHETMPVCKICNYNKYKYELAKKNKQKNKNNRPIEIKTIKLGINIEKSHLALKVKRAEKFLERGDKVCFSARLKGRELSQAGIALQFFNEIVENFKSQWIIDKSPVQLGREISFTVGKKINNPNKNTEIQESAKAPNGSEATDTSSRDFSDKS